MPVNTPSPKSPGPATGGKPMATGGKKPMNVWMIVSAVLAIALIISIITAGKNLNEDKDFNPISSEDAGSTLISFVNKVYAAQIGPSTLKSVTEKNGIYEIVVSVNNAGQLVDQTVFVSKDGKLFIPQALDMADVINQFDTFQQQGGIQPGTVIPAGDVQPQIVEPVDTEDNTEDELAE